MVCSHCGSAGHNKRTCTFECFGWPTAPCEAVNESKTSDSASRSERRAAKALAALLPPPNKSKKVSKHLDGLAGCRNIWKEPKNFYTKQKCRENTCATCGEKGHNARTCVLTPIKNVSNRQCSLCGARGHNKRTCFLTIPVKQKKCGVCDEQGHNARTCNKKCRPCADQTVRSYCFAGFTAEKAVMMAKVLECDSIYGETEDYPQLVVSPPAQRKTEQLTLANGESIRLDLGEAPEPVE